MWTSWTHYYFFIICYKLVSKTWKCSSWLLFFSHICYRCHGNPQSLKKATRTKSPWPRLEDTRKPVGYFHWGHDREASACSLHSRQQQASRRDPFRSKLDVGLRLVRAAWLANESQKLCHSKVGLRGPLIQPACRLKLGAVGRVMYNTSCTNSHPAVLHLYFSREDCRVPTVFQHKSNSSRCSPGVSQCWCGCILCCFLTFGYVSVSFRV